VVAFTIYLNGQGNNKGFAVEGSRLIVVKDGMTTADIAELLHEKKLIKNPVAFKMEARWKGLATKLQAGAYQIDGGMSNQQIVDVMVKGRIKQVRFTVPEGYSVAKTAKKLEAEGLGSADKFMAAAKDYAPYPYMQTDDSNVLCSGIFFEEVENTLYQRVFGTHYNHVNLMFKGKSLEGGEVRSFNGYIFAHCTCSRIAGSDIQFLYFGALCNFPSQSVFTAT
jgi:hypothetical protein